MSNVEHASDWSKLEQLLPQLGKEYQKLSTTYGIFLKVLAVLPPLLIPLEAMQWYSGKTSMLLLSLLIYVIVAVPIYLFTGRWIENLRAFAVARIEEEDLLPKMLDRIERDPTTSGEMSFEEIYLTDGSGLERSTRRQVVYAENDIEVNMDRGDKLFGNNNIPLMVNTVLVAIFCIYTIIGSFFLANEGLAWAIQQAMLVVLPLAIYIIQGSFRQHQLNAVLVEELHSYITGGDEAGQEEREQAEEGSEGSLQAGA